MSPDLLIALFGFALVAAITPGPNNVMLMASGANFGWHRTIPHMAGISLGFPLMVLLVGLGVMRVFDMWPGLYMVLKLLSIAYLLYLAWKIANAAAPGKGAVGGNPLTFLQAAAFQWVNPKAWSIALSGITLYAGNRELQAVLTVAGVYLCASILSTTSWTVLGQQIRHVLTSPRRLRAYNWTMAALLVATLAPVLWPAQG